MKDTSYAYHNQGDKIRAINPDPEAHQAALAYTEEWVIINAHSDFRNPGS